MRGHKKMNELIFDIGPIRPPSEAHSLLLRVTQGCTWNKCKFCDLYRGMKFSFTPLDEIKKTIDIIANYRDRIYNECAWKNHSSFGSSVLQ